MKLIRILLAITGTIIIGTAVINILGQKQESTAYERLMHKQAADSAMGTLMRVTTTNNIKFETLVTGNGTNATFVNHLWWTNRLEQ